MCKLAPVFMIMLFAGVSASIAAGDATRAIQDKQAIEKAVLKIHARMAQAARDLDPAKMFDYILDSGPGTIIQNGKLFKTRQDALDAVKNGLTGVTRTDRTFSQTHVTILAPDAALLTGDGVVSITLEDGRTFSSPFAITEVFVLREGRWKMLHGHHSIPTERARQ